MGRCVVIAGVLATVAVAAPPGSAAPADNLKPGQVIRVAGTGERGYSGDGWAARDARIGDIVMVTVGPDGTLYLSDVFENRLRVVTADGKINTLPGTGPATPVDSPVATAFGPDGALYIAGYSMVGRRHADGSVTVLSGDGEQTFHDGGDGGDGGPATEAGLGLLNDIAVDAAGNIYVSDASDNRIRKITPAGTITTVAGGGTLTPEQGEGGPATQLSLTDEKDLVSPKSLAVDTAGNVYFTLWPQSLLGKIAPDGTFHTVAGGQKNGFSGDGGPAGQAQLGDTLGGIDIDGAGNLYLADRSNGLIRMITPAGTITTVGPAYGGDDLAVGPDGDLYMSGGATVHRLVRHGTVTEERQPVRRDPRWTSRAPGTVVTVAGNGHEPPDEDSDNRNEAYEGPAPIALATGADGAVYVADPRRDAVHKVAKDGKTTALRGTGVTGPSGVAVGPDGAVYLTDSDTARIRKLSQNGGTTTTVANVSADQIAVDAAGNLIVTDYELLSLIRRVDPTGAVSTIAGGGKKYGKDAEGAPALEAYLSDPEALVLSGEGTLYFVDRHRIEVKAIGPDGVLRTVAGGRVEGGFSGDGGPASAAGINAPSALATGADGTLYLADTFNNRIRRITRDGVITTIAGTGEPAENGDGGPATKAALLDPVGLTADHAGNLYVAGRSGSIRRIDATGTITTIARLETAPADATTAAETAIGQPDDIAVDRAGTLYLATTDGAFAINQNGTLKPVDGIDGGPLATGGDGSLYSARQGFDRRYPDGAVVPLGGHGVAQPPYERGQPVMSTFQPSVNDIAVDADGVVYFADGRAVYRFGRDGILHTVVKRPATGIAIGPDGSLYLAEEDEELVERFAGGKLTTVAGTGESYRTDDGEGGPATETSVGLPQDVAVAEDGTVYVSSPKGISRVRPDGTFNTIVPATRASADSISPPYDLALDPHGNLYFTEPGSNRVRVVVRPGEVEFPTFNWRTLWLGLNIAVAVCVGAVVLFGYRKRLLALLTRSTQLAAPNHLSS